MTGEMAAQGHIDALQRKGWIEREFGRARAIRFPFPPCGDNFELQGDGEYAGELARLGRVEEL